MNYSLSKRTIYLFFVVAMLWYCWIPFLSSYSYDLLYGPTRSMIDDAYMFVRYAKNILAGHGVSWNMDDGPVYGITSQLHLLFVVFLEAFTSLRVNDDRVVLFASAIPGLFLLLYFPWVCTKHGLLFADRSRLWRYVFWSTTAGSAFIYFTQLDFHLRMGMETCLSALVHLCLIDAVLTFCKKPALLTKSLIIFFAFAAFLIRIDNAIVAFLFPMAYLFLVARKRKDALHVAMWLGAFILMTELFYWQYFGDFLPLSFYSKSSNYFQGFTGAIEHNMLFTFSFFLYGIWPFVFLAAFFFRNKNLLPLCIFIFPALVTISYYFTMLTIMNLGSRYCFPFTVYFAVAGCIYISSEHIKKRVLSGIVVALLSAVLYGGIYMLDKYHVEAARLFTKETEFCDTADMMDLDPGTPDLPYIKGFLTLRILSDMLKELPAGLKVVMTEYGYVGAANPHIHIVDVVGLHDPYVAHHGFSAEWLFQQKPDAIWVPHQDYTCINHDILLSKEFREQYEYYPGLFNWGYALRKDSPHYPLMRHALDVKWQEMYPGFVMEKYQKHYLK